MKNRFLIFSMAMMVVSAGWSAACLKTLVGPTQAGTSICEDTNAQMNFVDSISGPVTLEQFVPVVVSSTAVGSTTPGIAGRLYYCATCVYTPLCISTGVAQGAIVAVSVSTSATTGGFGSCK